MSHLSKNQIKFIKSLHQKKYRQKYQMFLLEGEKLVKEAIRDKPNIIEYLIIKDNYTLNLNSSPSIPQYQINANLFDSLSTLSSPPPIMAICKFLPPATDILMDLNTRFTFYLDNINDPGNLGTIIRICDWFGITQLFCSPDTVELYNPKTISACKGSFLRTVVTYIEFEKLKDLNIRFYIADTNGKSIYQLNNKNGIVVLGNESLGVSPQIKSIVKESITIPRHPLSKTESLNVAMSAAIIASEFSKDYL